jgi:prepilin-type N-terminal cleavage/methylation domain-containing protein
MSKGFTLVELVAVMAILAILVAVVAPAVTGTRDASVKAQTQADAKQVMNQATDYFGKQEGAETRIPLTTDVYGVDATGANAVQQWRSTHWPESHLTTGYAAVFEGNTPTFEDIAKVREVIIRDVNNDDLTAQKDILKLTAINFTALNSQVGGDPPSSQTSYQTVSGVQVHDFLWLFAKQSSDTGLDGDVRSIVVFQLVGTAIDEGVSGGTAEGDVPGQLVLTYKQVLGPAASEWLTGAP